MKKLAAATMVVMMLMVGGISAIGCSGSETSTFHLRRWGHNGTQHFTEHARNQATAYAFIDVIDIGSNLGRAVNGNRAVAVVRAASGARHNHGWW